MKFLLFSFCLFLILNQHILFALPPFFNNLRHGFIREDNLFNGVGFKKQINFVSVCSKLDELQEEFNCNLKTSEEEESKNDEDEDTNVNQSNSKYQLITACEAIHKIKQGDTCESLAKKYNMENDVGNYRNSFLKYQFDDCNNLPIGKVICLVNAEKVEHFINKYENREFKDPSNDTFDNNLLPQDETTTTTAQSSTTTDSEIKSFRDYHYHDFIEPEIIGGNENNDIDDTFDKNLPQDETTTTATQSSTTTNNAIKSFPDYHYDFTEYEIISGDENNDDDDDGQNNNNDDDDGQNNNNDDDDGQNNNNDDDNGQNNNDADDDGQNNDDGETIHNDNFYDDKSEPKNEPIDEIGSYEAYENDYSTTYSHY